LLIIKVTFVSDSDKANMNCLFQAMLRFISSWFTHYHRPKLFPQPSSFLQDWKVKALGRIWGLRE